jgi:hypothetical protein
MTVGNTPLGTDQMPLPTTIVPGNNTPVMAQGSTLTNTDNLGNTTTPANFNLKQVGDVLFALGQALKAASIPVVLPSDQVVSTLDANSASNNVHLGSIDAAISGAKLDLDALAAIVSSNKASIKASANDIVDLAALLARLTDTFGSSTAISAQTTLAAIPTTSGLVTNSFATLTNSSYQDTFIVQINVASAFVGTIGFYGLLPDGNTLQQINAHQRGTATNGNSTAINTSSALEQTWEGSIAGFKAIYVICSSYTSGTATVQLGLTAANYGQAILNTVASNLTQVGGSAFSLGQATKNTSLPVTIASDQGNINNASVGTDGSAIPASSTLIGASDGTNLQQLLVESASNRNLRTAIYNAANELGIDAGGRLTTIMQAVAGTALAADQGNTELRVSNYIKTSTAGDTALTAGNTTMANSLPVTMASDQTPKVTSTVTKTSVAAATSDTAILASNSSRKGAKFYNDSTAICYLSEGSGAASTSSYTVQIPANGFYEMPPEPLVTVAYRAIWSAANGNLRVTENT